VAAGVEPVRVHEVGVAQAERARLRVHPGHEETAPAVGGVVGQRDRSVVRALDERCLDQLADREAIPGPEVDGRLADGRGAFGHPHHLAETGMLERDEHGHQLRDAGDRQALPGMALEQHLAGGGVLDVVGAAADLRRGGHGRCGNQE
jgi:hypothetical protein